MGFHIFSQKPGKYCNFIDKKETFETSNRTKAPKIA